MIDAVVRNVPSPPIDSAKSIMFPSAVNACHASSSAGKAGYSLRFISCLNSCDRYTSTPRNAMNTNKCDTSSTVRRFIALPKIAIFISL